jgi:PmbA protein
MSRVATSTSAREREFAPSVDQEQMLERCRQACELAARAGAEEAEAYAVRSETISVRFEKGDLKLVQVDDGAQLGLRTFREQRLGFASTNQADRASLESAARDALSVSAFSPPHAANRLPAARPLEGAELVPGADVSGLSIEQAIDLGAELMRLCKARDARISIDNGSCDFSRVTHAVHSSRGVDAAESDAQLSLSVFGMAVDGADVGGFHYAGDSRRSQTGLERVLASLAEEFTDIAVGNLGAEKAESYRGQVLLSPMAFLSLCIGPLISASSAIAVQRGRSALAGKLGQSIATSMLTVHDDPTDLELAGATRFDREGQPATRFTLVEQGRLASWLYNGYAAAVEGRTSTGHARGGARSVPGLGPHSISVSGGGGGDRDALLRTLGRGLYVERFSGTVDPASGDFSGVAKSSRWVEGGRIVRPLKETLLSGNAFQLLAQIVQLSTHSERVHGTARIPYALVDGVSVTAG